MDVSIYHVPVFCDKITLKYKTFTFCNLSGEFMEILNNLKKITEKNIEILTILTLGIIFYLVFFHAIGTYPLMDVDETRYVSMARDMYNTKDFLTLFLNGEFFFEKPPLYFWQECLSFALWGKVSEWSARFPVALLGFLFSYIVYFTFKKIVNRRFGVVASLVLATSLEFIILAKYAILDIVLTFYIGLALIVYFQTFFCQEKNKKYFWWLFYLFSGLAVMSKGVPGFVVPFGVAFFCSIIARRFKENFRPIYMLPGILVFLLSVLPWHIVMFIKHNPLFYEEYIVKHHLHRFLNTENNEIGRKQPFYYYFVVILWGFVPWIFSFVGVLVQKLKNIKNLDLMSKIKTFDFEKLDNRGKILTLSWVCLLFILLFYSASSTKLVTYILPVYFPLAIITASFWDDYINKKQYEKTINLTVKIFGWLCAIAGFGAIFTQYYLPAQLNADISDAKIVTIVCLLSFGIGTLLCLKYKKYIGIFICYVLFMAFISGFATDKFFKIDYKFGQQDLIEFAQYAKENDYTISSFGMHRKYSLIYYNDKKADYNESYEISKELLEEDLNKENNVVIVKNKDLLNVENAEYQIIKTGRRYTMLKSKDK